VAGLAVLVAGMIWLNRDDSPTRLAMPTADGITLPTDSDGRAVDVPPSQPATAMSFGPGGQILRPDPTRARVVDDTGEDVVVPLAPNTTVDTITGDIIPMPDGGTGGTTVTTGGGGTTTPSTPPPTGTTPPTTTTTRPPPTTTTTQPPPTTTTTQPPPTTTTTTQPTTTTTADPGPAEP
jgi:hypothetical protein